MAAPFSRVVYRMVGSPPWKVWSLNWSAFVLKYTAAGSNHRRLRRLLALRLAGERRCRIGAQHEPALPSHCSQNVSWLHGAAPAASPKRSASSSCVLARLIKLIASSRLQPDNGRRRRHFPSDRCWTPKRAARIQAGSRPAIFDGRNHRDRLVQRFPRRSTAVPDEMLGANRSSRTRSAFTVFRVRQPDNRWSAPAPDPPTPTAMTHPTSSGRRWRS